MKHENEGMIMRHRQSFSRNKSVIVEVSVAILMNCYVRVSLECESMMSNEGTVECQAILGAFIGSRKSRVMVCSMHRDSFAMNWHERMKLLGMFPRIEGAPALRTRQRAP